MLSAFSVERCPPSRWNTVRHQHGIVSAIAWNTHLNMSFDERLALLVEREVYARSDRKRVRLLQQAQLKYPSATLEDASFEGIRGLDRPTLMGLALSTWIERGETVTLAGATGRRAAHLAWGRQLPTLVAATCQDRRAYFG